jgi:hypothetical protein
MQMRMNNASWWRENNRGIIEEYVTWSLPWSIRNSYCLHLWCNDNVGKSSGKIVLSSDERRLG